MLFARLLAEPAILQPVELHAVVEFAPLVVASSEPLAVLAAVATEGLPAGESVPLVAELVAGVAVQLVALVVRGESMNKGTTV